MLVHANGRNKTSGLELRQMQTTGGTCLFHVRSGRVTRLVIYYEFVPAVPVTQPRRHQ